MPSVFGASTINIINGTTNYTLYFNLVAKRSGYCYPQFRDYYPASPTGSGYCDLPPGSLSFNSYAGLASYYPGLTFTRKMNSSSSPITVNTANLVDTYMTAYNADWAYVIAKVENSSGSITEGAWVSFWDYASCDGLPDGWTQTYTESISSFEIGDERYFIVGEY